MANIRNQSFKDKAIQLAEKIGLKEASKKISTDEIYISPIQIKKWALAHSDRIMLNKDNQKLLDSYEEKRKRIINDAIKIKNEIQLEFGYDFCDYQFKSIMENINSINCYIDEYYRKMQIEDEFKITY